MRLRRRASFTTGFLFVLACVDEPTDPMSESGVDTAAPLPPVFFEAVEAAPDPGSVTIQEAAARIVELTAIADDEEWVCHGYPGGYRTVMPECASVSVYSPSAVASMLRTGLNEQRSLECVEANGCDPARYSVGCAAVDSWLANLPNRLFDLESVDDIAAYADCRPLP